MPGWRNISNRAIYYVLNPNSSQERNNPTSFFKKKFESFWNGGAYRIRTGDLYNANVARYQTSCTLSPIPEKRADRRSRKRKYQANIFAGTSASHIKTFSLPSSSKAFLNSSKVRKKWMVIS